MGKNRKELKRKRQESPERVVKRPRESLRNVNPYGQNNIRNEDPGKTKEDKMPKGVNSTMGGENSKEHKQDRKRKAVALPRPAKFLKTLEEERVESNSGANVPMEKEKNPGSDDLTKEYELPEGLSKKWDFLKVRKQGEFAIGYINLEGFGRQKKKHLSKVIKGMHQDIFVTTEH